MDRPCSMANPTTHLEHPVHPIRNSRVSSVNNFSHGLGVGEGIGVGGGVGISPDLNLGSISSRIANA